MSTKASPGPVPAQLPRRVACIASGDRAAQLAGQLGLLAGVEAVETSPADWPRAAAGFEALIVETGAFPSIGEFAAFASSASALTPVLCLVPDARGEAAALSALASLTPAGHVDLCRTGELAVQARARLALLALRGSPALEKDALTGLGSRQAMRLAISRALANLPPTGAAAAFILDFDYFKRVNDERGHAVGDALLQRAAALVMESDGFEDCVCRMGGDEFGGVLACPDRLQVAEKLEGLRRRIAETPIPVDGGPLRVTVSIGFAFLEKGMGVEDAYLQADASLYSAKGAGRNRVVCHDLFWDAAAANPNQAALAHFENVTRVWTQRMSELITSVGRRAIEESRRSAERDGLTELYTRGYFDRRIVREMQNAARAGTELSIVLTDIDDFHSVNMRYGYPTGDRALRAVADLARGHSRSTDWVARYGGEEFCVVMPGTTPADAARVAERLRAALEAATIRGYEARELRLTLSLGVASLGELPPGTVEGAALVQAASDRVVRAKATGKNRVVGPGGEAASPA